MLLRSAVLLCSAAHCCMLLCRVAMHTVSLRGVAQRMLLSSAACCSILSCAAACFCACCAHTHSSLAERPQAILTEIRKNCVVLTPLRDLHQRYQQTFRPQALLNGRSKISHVSTERDRATSMYMRRRAASSLAPKRNSGAFGGALRGPPWGRSFPRKNSA